MLSLTRHLYLYLQAFNRTKGYGSESQLEVPTTLQKFYHYVFVYLARKATPSIQSFREKAFTNLPATIYRTAGS